jgi:hypothetical protein
MNGNWPHYEIMVIAQYHDYMYVIHRLKTTLKIYFFIMEFLSTLRS